MRTFVGLLFLAIFVLILIPGDSIHATEQPYFPLISGMYSSYVQWSGSADVFYNVVGSEDYYGREAWAILRGYVHTFSSQYFEFYSIGADGDLLYHGRRSMNSNGVLFEQVLDPPLRVIDMPAAEGQSWTDTPTVSRYNDGILVEAEVYSYTGQIVALAAPVTVPAGEFVTLEVSGDWAFGTSEHYWFADGTGLIKYEDDSGLSLSLWGPVVAQESSSWGSVKALYR